MVLIRQNGTRSEGSFRADREEGRPSPSSSVARRARMRHNPYLVEENPIPWWQAPLNAAPGRRTRTCSTRRPTWSPRSSTGRLHTHPRPAAPHALASTALGGDLLNPFQFGRGGPGGWWILFEPELHLGEEVLVPDLAGWYRERMPDYPDTAYFTLAPDWVCEVLSPSTRKLDLHEKRPLYALAGVGHLWLVDPTDRTLEGLRAFARASGCSSPPRWTTSR